VRGGVRCLIRSVNNFINMDPEAFLEMANQVTKLKMFPYFDIAHCVICCLYAREDVGTGKLKRDCLRKG